MEPVTYSWVLSAHLIGVILWLGCMIATYWLCRIHTHTPKDARDQLTLMERSLAMVMDLAAAVAIGCGLAMAFVAGGSRGTHPASNLFAAPHAGWFHIKLTVVVLGILSVHGIVRARVARYSRGDMKPMPSWPWTVLLLSIMIVIIMVERGPDIFTPAP
jgi:uncharacterized membrane protein|nr:CopD family protein [Kofleriaceae bacterium]